MENGFELKEERMNAITHGVGLIMAVIGLVLLLVRGIDLSDEAYLWSVGIFGVSLVFVYAASTIYHMVKDPKKKQICKIIDHVAIYFLIAGTYTPYPVVTLGDKWGTAMLIAIWTIAVIGSIFKIFFTGRFNVISTLLYIGMGWLSLLIIRPIIAALPWDGFLLLTWGGVIYTLGAVFYLFEKMPYNHAVWHGFVMGGSVLHFLSIFLYVVPEIA